MIATVKKYYWLTKPGIVYGNLLSVVGAFLFGAEKNINWWSLLGLTISSALVIACGCVVNNYLDRDIDKIMKRTKKRALVTAQISGKNALIFAAIIGSIGISLLAVSTNALTVAVGISALISYALIYTYAKRKTVHGTLVGTLPGSLPLVAGYTAATNQLDITALILFIAMAAWQMTHFYAIALFRFKDYKSAKVPVMPVVHGITTTKVQMVIYILFFIVSLISLVVFSHAGFVFLALMMPLSAWWLWATLVGLNSPDYSRWAGKVFGVSLTLLLAFNACLALNSWMP